MVKDLFSLSLNNLRRRRLRSWLTILGIFIGIVAVVSLISLGQGLKEAVTAQFSTLSVDKLVIQNSGTGFGPPGSTTIRKLNSYDLKIIKGVNGVEYAIPRFIRIAKVEYNKILGFHYIASIPEDQKNREVVYDALNLELEDGKLLKSGDRGKIVLGSDFIKSNEFGKQIKVGTKLKVQDKEFEVVGILKPGGSFQANIVILMLDDDLKELLNIKDEIDLIVIQVSDNADIETVADNIKESLRRDRNEKPNEEDFSVQTPIQILESVNTILNIINLVIAGIAAISLIVGGIGIANTMYTSVLERTREIGTMKAIGAKNKDILTIFLIESGLLGLVGGIIGVIIGIGLSFGISFIANTAFGADLIKFQFSFPLIIGAVAFSFLAGMVSGFFPALRAAKLKPVEALRQ
jgi:putative ABC transport system permease protein